MESSHQMHSAPVMSPSKYLLSGIIFPPSFHFGPSNIFSYICPLLQPNSGTREQVGGPPQAGLSAPVCLSGAVGSPQNTQRALTLICSYKLYVDRMIQRQRRAGTGLAKRVLLLRRRHKLPSNPRSDAVDWQTIPSKLCIC